MISIVCVYNNERTIRNVLLKSLENQTAKSELITLDNRDNRYRSAAEALNYGGEKAKGQYIMFVHQDIWLGSNAWLEDVEEVLKSIPDLGIAGIAGMSDKGKNDDERRRWSMEDFGTFCGKRNPVLEPEEVQTLDECLLLVPRSVFRTMRFDEDTFDGWHCYGVDYCLRVTQLGLKAYVIPAFSSHSCLQRNMEDLVKYQQRLYTKHKTRYRHIYTDMGEISWLQLKLSLLRQFSRPFYFKLFPDLTIILQRELSGCDSVLDLGCGYFSPVHRLGIPFSVGVELFEPYLHESRRKGIHSQYLMADIRRLELRPKSFDAVIAVQVLEHLTKEEGRELLGKMQQWAREKVVITTTNGYLEQDTHDGNPLQEHRSGWTTGELRQLGFSVFGIDGLKGIMGYKGSPKYKPAFLWLRVSDLTQKITYRYPKLAFRLLAVTRTDESD